MGVNIPKEAIEFHKLSQGKRVSTDKLTGLTVEFNVEAENPLWVEIPANDAVVLAL